MGRIVVVLGIVVVVLLVPTVLSALFLVVGTVLSRVFPVTVFEATLVVLLVTGAVVWLLLGFFPRLPLADEEDDEDLPIITVPPPSPRRGSKRRSR